MNELQSKDSFFIQMLRDYIKYKLSVTVDEEIKTLVFPQETCFIYEYFSNTKLAKSTALARNKAELFTYADNKRKDKYTLLNAMETACKNNILDENEFTELFCKLTQKNNTATIDTKTVAEYKHKFLCGCIDDFFNNKGFSVDTGARKQGSKETSSSYLNELDMWCSFCEHNAVPTGTTSLTNEYEKECTDLFNTLKEKDDEDIFVPIYFDTKSGAGIFIVGSSHIFEPLSSECCHICAASFLYIHDDGDLQLGMESRQFSTIAEAFRFFKDNSPSFFQNYHEYNYSGSLNKIEEPFRQFFSTEKSAYKKSRDDAKRKIKERMQESFLRGQITSKQI